MSAFADTTADSAFGGAFGLPAIRLNDVEESTGALAATVGVAAPMGVAIILSPTDRHRQRVAR